MLRPDDDTISLAVELDAPPAIVWQALVRAEQRHKWWSYLDIDPRPGGRLLERWHDPEGRERTTSGEVLEVQPPHLLRCTWRDDDWPAATEVEFAIRAVRDASLLHLRHRGWNRLGALGADLRPAHESGWRTHLDDLKRHIEDTAADEEL